MKSNKIIPYIECVCISALLVLILIFNDEVSDTVRDSLAMMAERIIPSLFPYMVLSSIIVSRDLLRPICRLIPTEKFFSLPRTSSSVILTGLLCGFPVGAAGACKLYSEKKISEKDAEKLCALSSSVSPSFLIGCVGTLWNSKRFGIFLYLTTILFNVIAVFIISRKNKVKCLYVTPQIFTAKKENIFQTICTSVSDAAVSCLSVAAFVTFFRSATTLLSCTFPLITDFAYCMFEFSSGVFHSTQIGGIFGAAMCGFSVGFTGFSVMMQTYSLTRSHAVSLKLSIILSLIRGGVLAAASAIFFVFNNMTSECETMTFTYSFSSKVILVAILFLFISIIVSNLAARANYFSRKS